MDASQKPVQPTQAAEEFKPRKRRPVGKSIKKVKPKTPEATSKPIKPSPLGSEESEKNNQAKYPRSSIEKSLKIPKAILEQNAGKDCTEVEAAGFIGRKLNGDIRQDISSAIKFGLLERPSARVLRLTERVKKILRPQKPNDDVDGLREAVLDAPDLSDVYTHYRGEHLPDPKFFDNALVDKFKIPQSNLVEFKNILLESLRQAHLVEENDGRQRLLDVSNEDHKSHKISQTIKKLGKSLNVGANDTCFVVMPFAPPLGNHYALIYEPAIEKAGLKPVRADDEIFATGKIMDQIWEGVNTAKVLVAELTSRNPNVFYELGLAHALHKPVILISSNEEDVPFDVRHIRVIYYDKSDPFWGNKLIEKVAENILSALQNPDEAIFRGSK